MIQKIDSRNHIISVPLIKLLTTISRALTGAAVWACLGVDPLDMPRTPYRASEGKRSQ